MIAYIILSDAVFWMCYFLETSEKFSTKIAGHSTISRIYYEAGTQCSYKKNGLPLSGKSRTGTFF